MKMTTTTRQVNGVTIVDISGQIVFGEESAAMRELVCDVLGEGNRKILLNLADVNYIDSTGLGHLVSAVASVRKVKGELKLLKLTNKVLDVLQITKLHTIIDILDDEAVAIESFGRALTATA
jgi:anti-sigma B factor antagonist